MGLDGLGWRTTWKSNEGHNWLRAWGNHFHWMKQWQSNASQWSTQLNEEMQQQHRRECETEDKEKGI